MITGQGSYAVILLVLLLGSLKIAKFSGVSAHSNFSSFFQLCTYTTFEYLVRILFHVTVYVNVTILRKYSGNVRACTSSRYQAVSLLPRGLGTRLMCYTLLSSSPLPPPPPPSSSRVTSCMAGVPQTVLAMWL